MRPAYYLSSGRKWGTCSRAKPNLTIRPRQISPLGGQLNKLQVGYIVGVGYQLASGPNVGIRYNRSITRLYDGDAALTGGNNIYSSVFQFQLGFAFPGSK